MFEDRFIIYHLSCSLHRLIYETALFNSIDTDDSLLVLTFDTSTSKSHPKTACLPSEILLFIYDHLYRSTSPERKLTQLDLFSPHQTDAMTPCKQKTFPRCRQMLAHRLRRWANIKRTSSQCHLFAGKCHLYTICRVRGRDKTSQNPKIGKTFVTILTCTRTLWTPSSHMFYLILLFKGTSPPPSLNGLAHHLV